MNPGSRDIPVVVIVVDTAENIRHLIPAVAEMMDLQTGTMPKPLAPYEACEQRTTRSARRLWCGTRPTTTRCLWNTGTGRDVGFNTDNLYTVSLDPVRDGYTADQAAAFFRKLSDRIKGLPSVAAASLMETVPMAMSGNGSVTFSDAGSGMREIHSSRSYVVGRDYFETVGVPILQGRAFNRQDEANDTTAVIVSEKLVREFWNGRDALGRRIEIGGRELGPSETRHEGG
jgi:hypothetical protein